MEQHGQVNHVVYGRWKCVVQKVYTFTHQIITPRRASFIVYFLSTLCTDFTTTYIAILFHISSLSHHTSPITHHPSIQYIITHTRCTLIWYKLNESTYIVCKVIGDEFHFVLECKLFTDIKNRYILIFYRNHPSMYELITLINIENKNIIWNLGVFIQKAFELRNSIHYA